IFHKSKQRRNHHVLHSSFRWRRRLNHQQGRCRLAAALFQLHRFILRGKRRTRNMKVIIFAYAKENHTATVKWALEQAGYEVACWGGLSWTEQQQASLLLDAQTKMTLGPYTV